MALALTDAYPHLRATVIDLPMVTPVTQRFLAEAGAWTASSGLCGASCVPPYRRPMT